MLSRNSYLLGYRENTQTEFLKLVNRYLRQARELQILAGATETIKVTNCTDATMLLKVLGYRVRNGCGKPDMLLETANPPRAFLTIDSGFPLTQLEEALQTGVPFTYPYKGSWVPVMFRETDWVSLAGRTEEATGAWWIRSPTTRRLRACIGRYRRTTARPPTRCSGPRPQKAAPGRACA